MIVSRAQRTQRLLLLVALGAALLLAAERLAAGGQIGRCVAYFRAAGAWPFFIAMALLPVFGFPIWPFTVAAGQVFGPSLGVTRVIVCAILAQIANMTICYWLAARALRPSVQRLVQWLGYSLPETPVKAAWEMILLVRIFPGVPFFLQNYLLGLARVPFGTYLLISTGVHAGLVVGVTVAGDAMTRGDSRALASGLLLCVVAGLAIHRLRQRRTPGA